MRRPILYTVGVLAVLLLAAAPFLRVEFGGIDPRVLPATAESRVVSETVDRDFVQNSQLPIEAIVTFTGRADLEQYVAAVRGTQPILVLAVVFGLSMDHEVAEPAGRRLPPPILRGQTVARDRA